MDDRMTMSEQIEGLREWRQRESQAKFVYIDSKQLEMAPM